jgi:hypothetical protein
MIGIVVFTQNMDNEMNNNGNIDVLKVVDFKEPKNYSCQAQNYFGLVVFNLSIVLKGKYLFILACLFLFFAIVVVVEVCFFLNIIKIFFFFQQPNLKHQLI